MQDGQRTLSVFLDSITGHSFPHLQISTWGAISAKRSHELMADSHGVMIKSYRADNGIYAEKAFTDKVEISGPTIIFYGVGAHHQNGVSESHIGLLPRGSRTNLLHAQRRWPEAIGEMLWPFYWKDFERRYDDL